MPGGHLLTSKTHLLMSPRAEYTACGHRLPWRSTKVVTDEIDCANCKKIYERRERGDRELEARWNERGETVTMAKWRVRKYKWSDYKGGVGYGKRTILEEVIDALSVLFVDSTLHFFNNYDYKGSPITKAMRVKGEWFAVDRMED